MNPSNAVNVALAGFAAAALNFTDALSSVSLDPCTVAYTLSILAMLGVKVDVGGLLVSILTKSPSRPGAGSDAASKGSDPKE